VQLLDIVNKCDAQCARTLRVIFLTYEINLKVRLKSLGNANNQIQKPKFFTHQSRFALSPGLIQYLPSVTLVN